MLVRLSLLSPAELLIRALAAYPHRLRNLRRRRLLPDRLDSFKDRRYLCLALGSQDHLFAFPLGRVVQHAARLDSLHVLEIVEVVEELRDGRLMRSAALLDLVY